MPTTDSTLWPVKGQPFLFRSVIRSTATGNPITGELDLSAQISKDDADFVDTTNLPDQIGTSGYVSLLLTANEMDCHGLVVRITADAANALESAVEIKPADLSEPTGHWMNQAVRRLEQGLVQVGSYLFNRMTRNKNSGIMTLYKLDESTAVGSMTYTDSGADEIKGELG